MQWFYVKDGQQVGPVQDAEFQRLVRLRTIADDTLVWHEGMANWLPFGQVTDDDLGKIKHKLRIAGVSTQRVACGQCGREFPTEELVPYGQQYVCAECKPEFFQRVQEGAPTPGGGLGATPNRDLMAHARQSLAGRWWFSVGVLFAQQMLAGLVMAIPFCIGHLVYLAIAGPLALGAAVFFLAVARDSKPQFVMLFQGFTRFGTALGSFLCVLLFIFLWALFLVIPGIVGALSYSVLSHGFTRFGMTMGSFLFILLFILLALLFAIPAFIAALSYSMTFYVLADDALVGSLEAIKRSKRMMQGMKWKLFCLLLRFLGWVLLCILPYVLGFILFFSAIVTVSRGGTPAFLGAIAIGMVLILVGGVMQLFLNAYMTTSFAAFYDDVRGRASA